MSEKKFGCRVLEHGGEDCARPTLARITALKLHVGQMTCSL